VSVKHNEATKSNQSKPNMVRSMGYDNIGDQYIAVVKRYRNGFATISDVADVINASSSNSSIGSLWQMFINEDLRVDDFHSMMTLIADEVNPSNAAMLAKSLTERALGTNSVDLGTLLDILPEGRLRRYALESFLENATPEIIIKYSKYLSINENVDGGNLWVRSIVSDRGIDTCNTEQLKKLYSLFSGPGKYWLKQIMQHQAIEKSSSFASMGEYMTTNDYPIELRGDIFRAIFSKFDKNKLLNLKPSETNSDNDDIFVNEVSKRLVDLTNYQTAVEWIVNNLDSTEGSMAFDNRMKDWFRYSADAAAKKITTLENTYYKNRGYYLLAEYLNRPEEKDIIMQWINAISDEALKAEAIKKFGNR
jgi:hypothetical protein